MNEAVLQARGLSKAFGRGEGLVRAVDEVDLEVRAGETVVVMGPSGCGKSTLLHMLGGLERPRAGEIRLAPAVPRARSFSPSWPEAGPSTSEPELFCRTGRGSRPRAPVSAHRDGDQRV